MRGTTWITLVLLFALAWIANRAGRVGGVRGAAIEIDSIRCWKSVEDLPRELAVFQTVFWEPLDTESLRKLIRRASKRPDPLVRGKTVLEIGTGSGLVALCCLRAGASHVVATDINPAAIRNARFNAARLGLADRLDLRLVDPESPGAYSVIQDHETFDLIISNPPWEDDRPSSVDQYALYDPGFSLMTSLLGGIRQRLRPGGKAFLAYGCVDAINTLLSEAQRQDLQFHVIDERQIDSLPPVFVPGVLVGIRPGESDN